MGREQSNVKFFPGGFVSILPVQFESHSCIKIKWQA